MRKAIGIEFSDDSLAITCLKKGIGTLKMTAAERFPFRSGDSNEETLVELKRFAEEYGVSGNRVSLCLPRKWGLLRFMDIQAPSSDILGRLVRYEIERHMPFSTDDVYYDFQIVGRRGQEYRIALVILERERVEQVVEFLKQVPFNPRRVTIAPFSAINAAEYAGFTMPLWKVLTGYGYRSDFWGKKDGAAACIVLNAREADIAIMEAGSCRLVSTLPLNEGDSPDEIWSAVSTEMERSLRSVSSRQIERIVLVGENAEALSDYAASGTVIPVETVAEFKGTSYLGSAGAALGLYGLGSTNVNLLPGGRKEPFRTGPLITKIAAAAIVLLVISLGLSVILKERAALQTIDASIKKNDPDVKAIEKSLAELDKLEKQKKFLQSSEVRNAGKLEMLTELSNILPVDAWATNLDYKEVKNQPQAIGEIVLTGFSRASSSKLIPLLENSPYFKNVEFVGQVSKSTYGEGFRIKALVEQQVNK